MPLTQFLIASFLTATSSSGQESSPDLIPLVRALSVADGVAAVQGKDGEIDTVRVGDEIGGSLRAVNVLEDRLVAEGTDPASGEKTTYWIYKAGPSEKKSRVVRFHGKAPPSNTVVPGDDAGPKKKSP